jgi:hypothetical protein
MDVLVLNKQFQIIHVIDNLSSLIWVDRYSSLGDFELYVPVDLAILPYLAIGNYMALKFSDRLMTIKTVQMESNTEQGSSIIVKGVSIERILRQRIVESHTNFTGSIQNGIELLLNENVFSPSDPKRTIPGVEFVPSTNPVIVDSQISDQWIGVYVLDAIEELCKSKNFGYKLVYDDDVLKFHIYSGTNRSFNQPTNPHVTFSPSFDNLASSTYIIAADDYRNVAIVFGEGEGSERVRLEITDQPESPSGLDRHELYVDARDLSSTTSSGSLTPEQYVELLANRGYEKLAEAILFEMFEGEADANGTYIFGRDFFLGDLVQTSNEWGLTGVSRVEAITFYESVSGIKVLPKFVRV